jgi:hypothetical protein
MNSALPPPGARNTRLLPLRSGETPLATLALVGLVAAAAVAIGTGGYEFLFYIAVVAAITLVVTLLHRRISLSHASLWALLAWAGLHMAGGMWPVPPPAGVLYNFWLIPGVLKYDQLIHAYGFGVTAWICWQALCALTRGREASPLLLVGSALSAMGLGALNEVIEFAATKLVEKTNVGDYDNNAWDLVFNMLGAVISVLVIRLCTATPASNSKEPPS